MQSFIWKIHKSNDNKKTKAKSLNSSRNSTACKLNMSAKGRVSESHKFFIKCNMNMCSWKCNKESCPTILHLITYFPETKRYFVF